MSYYRDQLEMYLKDLDVVAGTVLDIGGGQKPVKGRTRSWDVVNYQILDLPDFDIQKDWMDEGADIIFCLEVFEYLIDPFAAFQNISNTLKHGGKAFISFPLIYPVHNEVELDSLRYTESGIRRLAGASGLSVDKVHYRRTARKTADWPSGLVNYYKQDGMKMAKGLGHEITGYIVEFSK